MEIMLERAIALAVAAHAGQRDKGGLPYILHPLAVMGAVDDLEAKAVAVLHDVVEDTPETVYSLLAAGIPLPVVDAVDAISKRNGESNRDYWARVKANPLALRVKRADIGHNTSPARMAVLGESERKYLKKKYQKALAFLAE